MLADGFKNPRDCWTTSTSQAIHQTSIKPQIKPLIKPFQINPPIKPLIKPPIKPPIKPQIKPSIKPPPIKPFVRSPNKTRPKSKPTSKPKVIRIICARPVTSNKWTEYNSLADAARATGAYCGNITKVIKGQIKTSANHSFKEIVRPIK